MAYMLTTPTFEIIRAYEINVNYVNTKTFIDENDVYLKFPDELVD